MPSRNNIQKKLCFIGLLLINVGLFCVNAQILKECELTIKVLGVASLTLSAILNVRHIKMSNETNIKTILCVISLISFAISKNFSLLYCTLMLFAMTTMSTKEIIKNDLAIKAIIIILNTFLSLSGLSAIQYTNSGNNLFLLGFQHPNHLGFTLFCVYANSCFIFNKKERVLPLIMSGIIAIPVLEFCGCRTAEIAILLYIIAYLLTKKEKTRKALALFTKYAIIPLTIVVLTLTVAYINRYPFATYLNEILSGRLWYQQQYYEMHTISLFGNFIETYKNFPLDNAYMRLLLNLGIIGVVFYATLFNRATKNTGKSDHKYLAYFATIVLYGLSEWLAIQAPAVPLLLASRNDGQQCDKRGNNHV